MRVNSNISKRSNLFLLIALILSIFTCFYNLLQYPPLLYDEGTYIGKAMHLVNTHSPQEGTLYDHPFFGQIFLGGILWLAGYSHFSPVLQQNNLVASVESLWVVPRLLTGMMGLIDTFFVFKISERRYGIWIAFMAAVLFALMPIVWFLRNIFLETIELPLLLSSIFIAIYASDTLRRIDSSEKTLSLILLSGVLMGLAIFTKISVFSMIPLFGYIFWKSHNQKLRFIGIWLIPVITIPLVWPAYALLHGEMNRWWDGIYWQSHRQMEEVNFMQVAKENTLLNAIFLNFHKMPIIIVVGFAGLAFSAIRKDFFLLIWAVPFLLFLFLIGFVREFHLIPVLPVLSISAAILIHKIIDILTKTRKNTYNLSLICIISLIVFFGVVNSPILFNSNQNNAEVISATAVIMWYLQDNPNLITMISNHVYSWIPKYITNPENEYLIPEISSNQNPKHEKLLLVADRSFVGTMSGNDSVGKHLRNIYDNDNKNITFVYFDKYKIILPSDWPSDSKLSKEVNLLDKKYKWIPSPRTKTSQVNDELKIMPNYGLDENKNEYSHSLLTTRVNHSGGSPVLLVLNYVTDSNNKETKYFIELVDTSNQNKKFWKFDLPNTRGNMTNSLFIVPEDALERNVKFRLGIIPKLGQDSLTIKKMHLVYPDLVNK